jgi:hypothetical protein
MFLSVELKIFTPISKIFIEVFAGNYKLGFENTQIGRWGPQKSHKSRKLASTNHLKYHCLRNPWIFLIRNRKRFSHQKQGG